MDLDRTRYDVVTFDCYGTLVDWDTGVANAIGPWVVGAGLRSTVADVVAAFAVEQKRLQTVRPILGYREVLRGAMDAAVRRLGGRMPDSVLDAFAAGVGRWPAFPDTIDALCRLRRAGLAIGIASNVDDRSFAETQERLGRLVDIAVTAERAGAYKPDPVMFEALFAALETRGIRRDRILHAAQSRHHDIVPANRIGLTVVWIDRRAGRPGKGVTIPDGGTPDARFESLEAFCDAFVPAAA